jgi:hypothetical protein
VGWGGGHGLCVCVQLPRRPWGGGGMQCDTVPITETMVGAP